MQQQRLRHGERLQEIQDQRAQAEADKVQAALDNEQRKRDRRAMREKRAKDEEKQRLRDEIRKNIIDRGDVKSPVSMFELLDIHGNYERSKHFIGALGGHVMQFYYVTKAIKDVFGTDNSDYYKRLAADPMDESLKKAQNPTELLMERYFMTFLIQTIRDLKVELIQIACTPTL